jgi:hypothetical protein
LDDLADTLCHYTTADAAFGHIVPSGELRMSPYARMRDPLENREHPTGPTTDRRLDETQTIKEKAVALWSISDPCAPGEERTA